MRSRAPARWVGQPSKMANYLSWRQNASTHSSPWIGIWPSQNARSLSIPVIVLHAKTNRLADLLPLVPNLLTAIGSAKPGLVTTVDAWPSLFLILRPARLLALHPLLLLLAQPVV